ncbi:glycosyltransferase family 2 [Caudovirales GX15bay]|nr:glycosyltransferase family 2 [Caudovirales GX15bay]
MVKDELDILPYSIQNLINQGVDGLLVADNMSTDGTWEWLQGRRLTSPVPLILQRDEEVAYYQSEKMSALAAQAFSLGAGWIVPFDADEFWYCSAPGGPKTLAEAVELAGPTVRALKAPLYNYFPLSSDGSSEPNPFLRITHRDSVPAPLPKVIVRRGSDLVIEQGNHGVVGVSAVPSPVRVAHFPWRYAEQFERKVRNGYRAYRATNLPDSVGAHWRDYGRILEGAGPAAIWDVFNTWFLDPPERELVHHPVPYARLGESPLD